MYIAVTDPGQNGGDFVVFNLTKSKRGPKALTFKVGEHSFITKYDSDVNFGDGMIVSLASITTEIAYRKAFPDAPMSVGQVERIARLAKDHPAVSREIQQLIKSQWKF